MTTFTDTATLTDRALAASADRTLHAARVMDRPHRVDDDLVVSWQGDRGVFTNLAWALHEISDWGDALARIDDVVPTGVPVSLVSACSTPELTSHGWQLVGHPPLMVRGADPAPAVPLVPAELTITEVRDEVGLEVWERALVDYYPEPGLQPYRWGAVNDGRVLGGPTTFYTGSIGGRPVATSAGHVAAGVNLVEMISTAPDARGRGYGAALTWAATAVDPTLPAVLMASDLGRPVYERLGFVATSRWTFWHRPA